MAFTEDLNQFFDTTEFAVTALISDGAKFSRSVNVILNTNSMPVLIYEADVEAPAKTFECQTADLAGVKRGMTATIDGKIFRIERMADDGFGTSTVHVSE